MDRLEAFYRGDLVSDNTAIGSASAQQAWDLDSVGNWQNFSETVGANSLDQQRTFNTVNEIADISRTVGPNWADPVYDAAGNMTRITRRAASPDRWKATWDAWNRLVLIEESDGEGGWLTKQENAYDAQNRRTIKKTYVAGSLDETRHYYWTASWQGIEERVEVSSVQEPERQYVYGLRYIDDVVLRDRDTQVGDSGSSSDALVYDERLYAMQDANWNVVALCDDLGSVQRRYAYQPYGEAIGLNASFGSGGPDLRWTKTFASYECDRDVDLFQVRWRWYSPLLGNWVSRDPALSRDCISLYLYVASNPISLLDPEGLEEWKFDETNLVLTRTVYVELTFQGTWTDARKATFGTQLESVVENWWNGNYYKLYPTKQDYKIYPINNLHQRYRPPETHSCPTDWTAKGISMQLDMKIDEYWWEDFHIYVTANPTGGFIRSTANIGGPYGYFDEADVVSQPKVPPHSQIPAVHEFGHLFGLPHPGQLLNPPAAPGSPQDYAADAGALMGSGMGARPDYFEAWREEMDRRKPAGFIIK